MDFTIFWNWLHIITHHFLHKKKSDKGHLLRLLKNQKNPKNTHLNSNNTVIKKIEIQNVTLIFTEKNMYNSHLQKTSKNLYTAMKFAFQISILTTAFSLHYNNLSTNCAVWQCITICYNLCQIKKGTFVIGFCFDC